MYTSINPTNDATIYSQYPLRNTGIDSMLEISKIIDDSNTTNIARSILKFNINDITSKLQQLNISNPIYRLKLCVAEETEIATGYTLAVLPLSESWDNGTGKFYNNPQTTDGISWTSSSMNSCWVTPGGTIINNSQYYCTQSFYYDDDHNTSIDITNIVNAWINGSITNNGILVKFDNTLEGDDKSYGTIKYYSFDSNTLYQPKLEILSNDFSFISSSNYYYTEIVSNTSTSYNTPIIPSTSFTNIDYYTNLYDVVTINSSSQYTSSSSTTGLVPILIDLPGNENSGSISGMLLTGDYNGSFTGYVDTINYYGSIISASFNGVVESAAKPLTYYSSSKLSILDVSGSLRGLISASMVGSFTNLTISGSYNGEFDIMASSSLTQVTSSYHVTVPESGTIYTNFASQSYYITGSNMLYPATNLQGTVVAINNLQSIYKNDTINKFKLHVRDQYPKLTYTTSSAYLRETYYLPSGSLYAIQDSISKNYIIDFDTNYTALNCNTEGNYFMLDCTSLYPERYYDVIFKGVDTSGSVKYFNGYQFKIIK